MKRATAVQNLLMMVISFVAVTHVHAQEMRDPTRPANKGPIAAENADGVSVEGEGGQGDGEQNQQVSFPQIKLSAIVVTEDRKYAIIGNEVVYEGQQWKSVFLSKIKPYSVTFRLNDLTKEITINNNDFITESNDQF